MTALRALTVLAAFASVVLTSVQGLSLLAPDPGSHPEHVLEMGIVSVVLVILALIVCAPHRTEP